MSANSTLSEDIVFKARSASEASDQRVFKNPEWGQYYLKPLFFEESSTSEKHLNLYTLKTSDHKGLPSLHRLYVEMADPTEYIFANTYFDGWKHWKMLKECNWFKEHYDLMYEELQLKLKAEAYNRLLKEAQSEGRNSAQINKYLLDNKWFEREDHRGRPSKESIKKEANKIFQTKEEINSDWERLIAPSKGN